MSFRRMRRDVLETKHVGHSLFSAPQVLVSGDAPLVTGR